jgi:hypothetical protein
VHELDVRLERLATEATRDAVPPELEAVARRGRSGHDRAPATALPTDVRGAASLGGYWFGKADATVFLRDKVTPGPARRRPPAPGGSGLRGQGLRQVAGRHLGPGPKSCTGASPGP